MYIIYNRYKGCQQIKILNCIAREIKHIMNLMALINIYAVIMIMTIIFFALILLQSM